MDSLFSDRTKFKPIKTDPTHRRLSSIQIYLRNLVRRGELDKESYKNIRPRHAKPARAHGLPKIHKAFDLLPKFRPIIDTTGTTHYSVGKFISELLQPLTNNEYTLKDTFDAANRIKAIPRGFESMIVGCHCRCFRVDECISGEFISLRVKKTLIHLSSLPLRYIA